MTFSKIVLIAVVSVGAVTLVGCGGGGGKSKQAMCEDIFEGGQKMAAKMGTPVLPKEAKEAAKKVTVSECVKQADDVVKVQHKAVMDMK